jgi:hypothetical protein
LQGVGASVEVDVGGISVDVAVGVSVNGMEVTVFVDVFVGTVGDKVVPCSVAVYAFVAVAVPSPVLSINGILQANKTATTTVKTKYRGVARVFRIRPPHSSGIDIFIIQATLIKTS